MHRTVPSLDLISRLQLPMEFPQFFPNVLEKYRRSLSESTDVPDEYAAAFMLSAGATAAGGDVSACVQPGWCVRSNLYAAVVGFKGNGKSTLADKVLAPLVLREEELLRRPLANVDADNTPNFEDDDYDDEDIDVDVQEGVARSSIPAQPNAVVIVNDCTGPAVLKLLGSNPRQLLVHVDELSAQFVRNTGGTDRQLWCELFDGRRRRQHRASSNSFSATLAAPYVNLFGGIQPDLLPCFYNTRGDDGLLDRILLVGTPTIQPAAWPRDADDPGLNGAWRDAVLRLFHVEKYAEDAINQQVEARFTPEAVDICKRFMERLNDLVVLIGVPASQCGVVKKLVQHAAKLALLHRCFRWAVGEFGERGAFGDIDQSDATAACEATLFFFGRWLIWRPELTRGNPAASGSHIGLASPPAGDPALAALSAAAADAQASIGLIERLIRYARHRGHDPLRLSALRESGPFNGSSPDELRKACDWLLEQRQGEWLSDCRDQFRLFDGRRAFPEPTTPRHQQTLEQSPSTSTRGMK